MKSILLLCLSLSHAAHAEAQSNPAPRLPVVKILGTGGTIVNGPQGYAHPEEVLKTIPEASRVATVRVDDFMRKASQDFSMADLLAISKKVNAIFAAERDVDGVVVTEGSNTVEETAYFLNLTVKSDKPVIVTAANRRFGTLSSDSPKNLLDAISVAAAPESRGKGVMVVANSKINAAHGVMKVDTYDDNYQSRDLGLIGFVDTGQVRFHRASTRKHTTRSEFDVASLQQLPKVYVVYTYLGADDVLFNAALEQGKAEGIVVASFAAGPTTPALRAAMDKAAERGIAIVYANRGGQGRLPVRGNSKQVSADVLSPQQAFILLTVALTKTRDPKELQRIFLEY